MNIALEAERLASVHGWLDKPAFITTERHWIHADIHAAGRRLAGYLHDRGIMPSDKVVIALDDSPLWVALFLGLARLGATALVVNPHLPAIDHRDVVAAFRPKFGVVNNDVARHFTNMTAIPELEILAAMSDWPERLTVDEHPTAPLYVQFTSGTTGKQKGVPHTHQDVLVYRDAVADSMLHLQRDDILFSVSKLFFAYGFGNSLAFPLTTGAASLLLAHRPAACEVTELIERHGVTVLFWVPSGYAALVQEDTSVVQSRLRLAISAGEALPPDLSQRLQEALKSSVLNQLGSTEAGHAYCGTQPGDDPAISVGRPLPGYQLAIHDWQGKPVAGGEAGELWVKGPTLPSAYLNDVEKSENVFVEGWLRSGDCAMQLPDGSFQLLGRLDDMEMVGGIKVSPLLVESVLRSYPEVNDVAVIARVETGKSQLVAYICCTRPLVELESELRSVAKKNLAPYMVPRRFYQVAELPRTINGKLRRHILRSTKWIAAATKNDALARATLTTKRLINENPDNR